MKVKINLASDIFAMFLWLYSEKDSFNVLFEFGYV
jgi:hypothetical protein